jgi:2-iminobutanoate/2-iminopropanoate deaminase
MDNIVDETLFVTDLDSAFAAAIKCRNEVFFGGNAIITAC